MSYTVLNARERAEVLRRTAAGESTYAIADALRKGWPTVMEAVHEERERRERRRERKESARGRERWRLRE